MTSDADQPQIIPGGDGYGEHQDRGSRFLAWVFHAPDEATFLLRLAEVKAEHAKARHWCSAWNINGAYRFDDDGEPGGTAGRPMLQVIEGSGMQEIAAICVRYFGGVKLGTGGLVRAYSGATSAALDATPRHQVVLRFSYSLELPFNLLGLRTELEALCPSISFDGEYTDRGWVGKISIDEPERVTFENLLDEKSAGSAAWQLVS